MRFGRLTTFALFATLGGALLAARLPPIGERKYVIDDKTPDAPVTIERATETPTGRYLKDPIQPSVAAKPVPVRVVAKTPAKPPPAARSAQLHFRKMPVSGHLTRPRVAFTHDLLPVDRADEPVSQNFFPKVFAPAQDEAF